MTAPATNPPGVVTTDIQARLKEHLEKQANPELQTTEVDPDDTPSTEETEVTEQVLEEKTEELKRRIFGITEILKVHTEE